MDTTVTTQCKDWTVRTATYKDIWEVHRLLHVVFQLGLPNEEHTKANSNKEIPPALQARGVNAVAHARAGFRLNL